MSAFTESVVEQAALAWLEIISIGELHFGLAPEALFREHESKPWNPMIARTFYRRGIIETRGRGGWSCLRGAGGSDREKRQGSPPPKRPPRFFRCWRRTPA